MPIVHKKSLRKFLVTTKIYLLQSVFFYLQKCLNLIRYVLKYKTKLKEKRPK